mmetsp:Transcript_16868/g.46611  ORF Transcript_16868/g.46611 Transcript_16868/m.46611 type:complete len:93 (-) Transcript_16868:377-655(-)|eukprot:CAMPEP_0198119122 /NCGR_PEP_ID=MMETSP1442-20131203/24350_1 /TAXON_ID= /ORGANISM="Craspedostauros australis, Strain CCMP3328" /LENGTH=92 /DNA_ID=CAMNT_0043777527 /DNA_START=824 /DNA_END=1102 /DNA_ORIENTATION=-
MTTGEPQTKGKYEHGRAMQNTAQENRAKVSHQVLWHETEGIWRCWETRALDGGGATDEQHNAVFWRRNITTMSPRKEAEAGVARSIGLSCMM